MFGRRRRQVVSRNGRGACFRSVILEGSTLAQRQSFRTHSFRTQNLQRPVSHLPVLFCQLPRVSISGAVDMLEL